MKTTNEVIMYSNLKEYINLFDNPKDLLADFLQYRLVPPHIGVAVLNVVLANSKIEGFNNISFIKVFDRYDMKDPYCFSNVGSQIVIIDKDHKCFILKCDSFESEFIKNKYYKRSKACSIQITSCKTYMEEAIHNIATLINELI